jgi:hypothetical protein
MPTEEEKCEFYVQGWNDQEQKNYMIHECENPENNGGKIGLDRDDGSRLSLDVIHTPRMYSCWHKNEGMAFRCWGDKEKIKQCPLVKKAFDSQ